MSPHIGIHLHLSNFGISVFIGDSNYNDQHQDDKYQKSYQTDNSQSPDSGALKVDRLAVLEIPVREAVNKLSNSGLCPLAHI